MYSAACSIECLESSNGLSFRVRCSNSTGFRSFRLPRREEKGAAVPAAPFRLQKSSHRLSPWGRGRSPFAKISAGNASRTEKQKEISPEWTGRACHKNGMSVSHRDMSEVWEKSNIWETAKGHRKNTEDAVRIRDGSAHRSICNARSYQATSFGRGLGCWAKPAVPAEAPPSAFASGMERSGSLIERLPIS